MTISARALLASALALIAGLAVGVGLVAARGDIETNSLIFFTKPNTFNGSVTAAIQKCIPQRQVRVKRVRNGKDRVLAEDTTKANGFFDTVVQTVRGGGYYAAVKRREINAGVCAPVHSNTTTVTAKTAR